MWSDGFGSGGRFTGAVYRPHSGTQLASTGHKPDGQKWPGGKSTRPLGKNLDQLNGSLVQPLQPQGAKPALA
ncbi:hypothetical protein GCM10009569_02810 [Arthrobacter russicus]